MSWFFEESQQKYSNQRFLFCGFKIKQIFVFYHMKNKQITDCIKNFDKVVEARRGGRGQGGGVAESNWKPEICSFCGEAFALT